MRLINISKIFFCTILLSGVVSCKKQLNLEPIDNIDATTAIQTPADVEAAVVGAYSIMGGGALYGTNLVMIPELLAQENYASWRGTFQSFRQVATKTMNRDNTEARRIWTAAYLAINTANIVLDALNVVTDPDQKDQFEGEALFVRGIMHFELVRLFALPWDPLTANSQPGVVIETTATKTEVQAFEKTPRSTVAQVYAQAIADLTAAANKLPDDNGTRADRFAALAFLAKIYLQQSDYAKARDAANELIQSGKYRMNAAVTAVFDNKNTDESIFEIQQNDQNNAGDSNDGLSTFFASLPGIGRADVRILSPFLISYDPNDLRRTEWYYVSQPPAARPGNTYTSKWKSPSQNIPIVRIAEMYLIRAESNLRLGTLVGDTPTNDLAQIRNLIRTNLPVILVPTVADVLAERSLELAFEGFKIHEIRRLKGTVTATIQWNDSRLVFPIPQREIDASEGILTQNPGY